MPEKAETPKKKSRFKWLIYLTFWVVMAAAFAYLAYAQAAQYSVLQVDLARLRTETEQAEAEHERLLRQKNFIGTDTYIEEQARQRLGMVMPTELIFINVAE